MKKISIVTLLYFSLFSIGITAKDQPSGSLPPLEWQKENLIKNLQAKIKASLTTLLKSDEFFVDIKIDLNEVAKPDFLDNKNGKGNNKNNADASGVSGTLGKGKAASNFESIGDANTKSGKKEATTNVDNKNKIRFKDTDPSFKDGDYIVFSKFGIVAPLIDDYNDFQPNGKIILSMEGGNSSNSLKKKLNKLNQKLSKKEQEVLRIKTELNQKNMLLKKSGKVTTSYLEQLWKYNQSLNIFNNLKKVAIKVSVSDVISVEMRTSVENILHSLHFNLGKIKPKIDVSYLNLRADKKINNWEDYLGIASKFSTIIAMLIGIFFFGRMLKSVLSKLENVFGGSQKSSLDGRLESNGDNKDENGGLSQGMGIDGATDASLQTIGIERFEAFFENSSNNAIVLIKKWIKQKDENSTMALRAIVQQLDNTKLMNIFQIISLEEREMWKEYLDKSLNNSELVVANSYISRSIVEEIIAPSAIKDEDVNDMILNISAKNASKFIESDPKLGAILLNIMNKKFVGEVVSFIDSSKMEEVIDQGMNFKRSDIESNLEALKNGLGKFIEDSSEVPFLARVQELIPHVNPDKENILFVNLAKNVTPSAFLKIARQYFPYILVKVLPQSFLREQFRDYEMSKKVNFLLTLAPEEKNFYISVFAPPGSKILDVLNFEFENINRNEHLAKKIRNEKFEIQKDFLNYIRDGLKLNPNILNSMDEIIEKWASNVGEGEDANMAVNSIFDTSITEVKLNAA